jgi:hypothetical protein
MQLKIDDIVQTRNNGTCNVCAIFGDSVRLLDSNDKLVTVLLSEIQCVQAGENTYRWDCSVNSVPR